MQMDMLIMILKLLTLILDSWPTTTTTGRATLRASLT